MLRLAGHGSFAELEHVGRTSGRIYRIPLMAFREGDLVTIALTYGSDVDWLKNVRRADGCRLRLGGSWLELGPPRDVGRADGMRRMPPVPRTVLPLVGCRAFVELSVLPA